jgi:hypothetical protein
MATKRPPKASKPPEDKAPIGIVRKALRALDYIELPAVEPSFPWDPASDRVFEEVCAFVSAGCSLSDIARAYDVNIATVWRATDRSPERAQAYARAQAERAHVYAGRITDLAMLTTRGLVDPQAARVALDAYKWTASKLVPKTYGDKLEVEARVEMSVSDALNGLSASPVPPIPALPKTGG